jgi:hypothetical protein
MLNHIQPYVFAIVCTWPDRIVVAQVLRPLIDAFLGL